MTCTYAPMFWFGFASGAMLTSAFIILARAALMDDKHDV